MSNWLEEYRLVCECSLKDPIKSVEHLFIQVDREIAEGEKRLKKSREVPCSWCQSTSESLNDTSEFLKDAEAKMKSLENEVKHLMECLNEKK